jgi:hypothetical protein
MSRQFSRLSAVCKVLFDAEVIALRKENEELKLSVFWTKYSPKKLRSAIKRGNRKMPGIPRNCNCFICGQEDRFWGDGIRDDVVCTWKPLFEAKLVELGIGFSDEHASKSLIRHECVVVVDCDTHIVNLLDDYPLRYENDNIYRQWSEFAYGFKLFMATTVNDPELHKLVALFEWLPVQPDDDESTDDESRLVFRPQEL